MSGDADLEASSTSARVQADGEQPGLCSMESSPRSPKGKMSQQMLDCAREVFRTCDEDGSGTLDADELSEGAVSCPCHLLAASVTFSVAQCFRISTARKVFGEVSMHAPERWYWHRDVLIIPMYRLRIH